MNGSHKMLTLTIITQICEAMQPLDTIIYIKITQTMIQIMGQTRSWKDQTFQNSKQIPNQKQGHSLSLIIIKQIN